MIDTSDALLEFLKLYSDLLPHGKNHIFGLIVDLRRLLQCALKGLRLLVDSPLVFLRQEKHIAHSFIAMVHMLLETAEVARDDSQSHR